MNVTVYEALRRANVDIFSNLTNASQDEYNATYRQDIIDDKAVQVM